MKRWLPVEDKKYHNNRARSDGYNDKKVELASSGTEIKFASDKIIRAKKNIRFSGLVGSLPLHKMPKRKQASDDEAEDASSSSDVVSCKEKKEKAHFLS